MTKILISLILILVFGLAVFGYFKAVPQEGQARIEISPEFYDFGEVEYGQVLEYNFKIKNIGPEILEIKRIATSCACTTGKVEKKRLNPNQETSLLVTYDTGAMSGPHGKGKQERIIFIKSNDSQNPQVEVKIQAYVR